MKSNVLVAITFLILSTSIGLGQKTKAVEPAGLQFWTAFKSAVAKNDKEAVASMTRLPFLFQGRELAKAAFVQKFETIFGARVKRCFTKATLVKEGEGFEVFCGQQIFLFEKVNGVYKFTEIGAND